MGAKARRRREKIAGREQGSQQKAQAVSGKPTSATVSSSWRVLTPGRAYALCVAVFATASLWIRSAFPVSANAFAGHDDLLFVQLARSISSGEWLGSYNEVTLAKGMFYSIFIAAAHFVHVPLKIAEQAVYLAACLLAADFVRRRTRDYFLAGGVFGLLAFNPVVWCQAFARVLRDGLYLSLPLIVVLLFVALVFPSPDPANSRREPFSRIVLGIVLGLTGAAYWLTREEGIWLLPSLCVVLLTSAVAIWRRQSTDGIVQAEAWPRQVERVALPLSAALLGFLACDLVVAGLNYQRYGIFETNEMRASSFLKAYGALTRIQHDQFQKFVPFPKDARERAYQVSSAARELQPAFEGPIAEGWRRNGCQAMQLEPCTEVLAGWFVWELRNAIASAGHWQSAPEAMQFCERLADEINDACSAGKTSCSKRRDTLSPAFRAEYLQPSLSAAWASAKKVITLHEGPLGSTPSLGSLEQIQAFAELVGDVSQAEITQAHRREFKGWAGAKSGAPQLALLTNSSRDYLTPVTTGAAPDVTAEFPELKAVRFRFATSCPLSSCALDVRAPGSAAASPIPLSLLIPGTPLGSESMLVMTDAVDAAGPVPVENEGSVAFATASVVSSAYAYAMPVLFVLGAIGFGLASFSKISLGIPPELWALAIASLVAVLSRIALLAYITASAFPATNLLYASSATPFLILFAVLGIHFGLLAARSRAVKGELR